MIRIPEEMVQEPEMPRKPGKNKKTGPEKPCITATCDLI
jgi:hypothetical protein